MWLPPKVWLHGSQSTSTGGRSARKRQSWPHAAWLVHSMRCVLITPLGAPVEPEVNRIFATVSGPMRWNASSSAWRGTVARSAAIDVASIPGGGLADTATAAPPSLIAWSAAP